MLPLAGSVLQARERTCPSTPSQTSPHTRSSVGSGQAGDGGRGEGACTPPRRAGRALWGGHAGTRMRERQPVTTCQKKFFGVRVDFSYQRWLAKHPRLAHAPLVAERDPQDMQNVPEMCKRAQDARRPARTSFQGGVRGMRRVLRLWSGLPKNRKVCSSRDGRRDIDLHVLGPRMKPSGSVTAQHVCCSGRRVGPRRGLWGLRRRRRGDGGR